MKINKYITMLVKERSIDYDVCVDTPESMADMLRYMFKVDRLPTEHFWEVCINAQANITGAFEIGIGDATTCITDIASIARNALLSNAYAVVIAHNHPSGGLEPSVEDIMLTKRVREALSLLGIKLEDHLILARSSDFVSLKEQGVI